MSHPQNQNQNDIHIDGSTFLTWIKERWKSNETYNYDNPYFCPLALYLREEFLEPDQGICVLSKTWKMCDWDQNGNEINKKEYPISKILDETIQQYNTYGALAEALEEIYGAEQQS